ncbi:MAG: right-handed parallel beta-helix repeat-containing protein [Rudaea sp.]
MGVFRLKKISRGLCALVAGFACVAAHSTTIEIGPGSDFRSAMQNLHAGDTLLLDSGTYTLTSQFQLTLVGNAAAPIVIMAKPGQHLTIHFAGTSQNIVDIVDSQFLTIEGIEFTGGSRGLRFIGGSDITVRNCSVHDVGANAISANDHDQDYARFNFVHNEVYNTGVTGEAFYLGCNGDACRIHDSLVANNYIHDLQGASSDYQGDGIEIKKGSYANIVRDNVIHDTHYPGITMYDVNGHGAPNLVEGNIVWHTGDNGIQITADAIVRNNVVLSAAADAFASLPIDGGSAANLTIVNNTFFAANGQGIRLNGVTGAVTVANNAIYAPTANAIRATGTLGGIISVANAGIGSLTGVSTGFTNTGNVVNDFVSANLGGAPPQNLIPKSALLVGAASATYLPIDDFDGFPRSRHADVGAYRAGGTPGWPLAATFKIADHIFFGSFEP